MTNSGLSIELFERVAAHLSGRPVVFRWQEPVWNFASGAAYKSLSNDAIIDVNPGATSTIYTFLHEVAHVRVHWGEIVPSYIWHAPPGSQTLPAATRAAMRAHPCGYSRRACPALAGLCRAKRLEILRCSIPIRRPITGIIRIERIKIMDKLKQLESELSETRSILDRARLALAKAQQDLDKLLRSIYTLTPE